MQRKNILIIAALSDMFDNGTFESAVPTPLPSSVTSRSGTSRDTERAFARIATVSFRYGSAMSFDVKIEQQPRLTRYQRHPSFDHDMERISRIYQA
jgi:hypothetical protein